MAFNVANTIRELNFFRHGVRQTMVTLVVFSFCVAFAMLVIDRWEKARFIDSAKQELQQETISPEILNVIKGTITETSILDSAWPVLIVIGCLFFGRVILSHVAGPNWSRAVTLPYAVEFSSAMRKIGLFDFSDQRACVHKHRLRVYIANTPLLEDQGENICAKLYSYAHNDILVLEDLLTKSIGKRLLCLDADDYNPIYQQYNQTAQSVTLAKIAELEGHINALKGVLSLKNDENKKLNEENKALNAKQDSLAKKLKMVKPRNGKDEKGDFRKLSLWRLLIPLCDRLKAEAQPGSEYTRPQIQKEFFTELEKYPELKEDIQKLLWPEKQTTDEEKDQAVDTTATPKNAPDWVIEIVRKDLQNLAKRKPGAPPKP